MGRFNACWLTGSIELSFAQCLIIFCASFAEGCFMWM